MSNTRRRFSDVITLASTSSTRQALFRQAGLDFISVAPYVDEKAILSHNPQWTPQEASRRLAKAKALDVSARQDGTIVVGADQVLACDGQIFAKPLDQDDCLRQLQSLRGKTHYLLSSVVCASDGTAIWTYFQTAAMTMRHVSNQFLDDYIRTVGTRCTSSVGGYQLEDRGVQLFERVDGDYFTILGLPMIPLLNFLRLVKVIPS